MEEREEKERRERDKKHREDHDRKERERAEDRERRAREKDRDDRERKDREQREREREKRAEHEKERLSRINENNHTSSLSRRDASRSPLRTSTEPPKIPPQTTHPISVSCHPTPPPPNSTITTAAVAPVPTVSHSTQSHALPPPPSSHGPTITPSAAPNGPGPPHSTPQFAVTTSTITSVTNSNTTHISTTNTSNTTSVTTSTTAAISVKSSSNTQQPHVSSKLEHRPDSRPASRPGSGPSSRPNSRPSSRPADHRSKSDARDDIMIVGSKEAAPRPQPPSHPAHSMPGMVMHHPSGALMPPHTMSSVSSLERARLMGAGYPQGPAMWNDPFRGAMDPYRQAANNEALAAARYELLAREHMRDPLRDSLDRAREEHLLRSNPLGSLILSERYREHQAREMFERERQLAAAAAGFYPSTSSSLLPPHPSQHLLGPQLKSSPLVHPGHPGHPGLHPHSHPGLSGLHPGHHPGHPMPPGLPPPLISSRPPDKKDEPR